jgi:hypothetical protein
MTRQPAHRGKFWANQAGYGWQQYRERQSSRPDRTIVMIATDGTDVIPGWSQMSGFNDQASRFAGRVGKKARSAFAGNSVCFPELDWLATFGPSRTAVAKVKITDKRATKHVDKGD